MSTRLRGYKILSVRHKIETKELNKRRMKQAIALSEPIGLGTGELVKELSPCVRATIYNIAEELKKEDEIFKTGGKRGKYHLKPKKFEDPEIIAFLFELKSMSAKTFYRLGTDPLCLRNIFCNKKLCKTALTSDRKTSDSLFDSANFFEFSLRLGAIVTYELLQAIRYSQPQQQQQDTKINSNLRNERMYKYIENALKPWSWIFRFGELLAVNKRLKPRNENITTKKQESEDPLSVLELQDGKFKELETVFKKTFPELFKDLEKVRKTIRKEAK
jgi:hypothetical protein